MSPAASTQIPQVTHEALDALATPSTPIDIGLLSSLPTLSLRARYLVDSFLTGRHRSPLKGTAPEFAEYRAYQLGDELRRIDWRLYARSDRLAVKQYDDENQFRLWLSLDVSASLRYASRPDLLSKFDLARTVLSVIALLARRQQDAVGLALFGDDEIGGGLLDYTQPGSGGAHYHVLLSRLEAPPLARTARIDVGLRRMIPLITGSGLVVIASDFYCDLASLGEALRLFRTQRQEIVGLRMLDPREVDFDGGPGGRFVDLESGEYLPLNPAAVRQGYLRRFAEHAQALSELFHDHDASLVTLRSDSNPLPALITYLARRRRLAR